MELQTFAIENREKHFEAQIPQVEDFTLRLSHSISSQSVLNTPNITLYCLDQKHQAAVFVETPTVVNLARVPFYYMAQFAHATRVIMVPYEELHHLAQQVPLEGQQLILIYSIGRSGSTLTSAAFNHANGVISLSEPDVFTNLVVLRDWNGTNDQEVSALVRSCTRMLCKRPEAVTSPQKWAIKFRSFGIELGDLLYRHFSAAKCLFLYRNLDEWADSMVRAFGGNDETMPEMLGEWWKLMKSLVRESALPSVDNKIRSLAYMLGINWISLIERYLHLADQGIPMLPVRYEDLKRNTLPVMEAIFSYCGVTPTTRHDLRQVLNNDSQAGSLLAREITQSRQFGRHKQTVMHELHALLTKHPTISRSDFEVPGTLRVA